MGDRANFGFTAKAGEPTVFLYGHSSGYRMMSTLAHAIEAARGRWDDDGYATRICISQIVGDRWDGELGFGIYVNETGDNEHSVPVVNWEDRTVTLYPEFIGRFDPSVKPLFVMDFDMFIQKYGG